MCSVQDESRRGESSSAHSLAYFVQRKPYTVGNKTVFLSDEELEVFKMTMGKEQANELVPTPMSQLEPALVHNATMAATSSALASVARPPQVSASCCWGCWGCWGEWVGGFGVV